MRQKTKRLFILNEGGIMNKTQLRQEIDKLKPNSWLKCQDKKTLELIYFDLNQQLE